ncbi:guanitoxin biosynthesis L-enduracididine beta-hydroxylase GntD [Nonomuraea sp. NPDC049419]|uniref:guanitoxin biosynthesis L-enduracididine beta-hydroxylase GntD n=1 Tax=Nonomuraea sp. NPDC049419 TaxID=3155772 RepID=UPI00342A48BC
MFRIRLGAADLEAIGELVGELRRSYASVEDPRFLATATTHAQELPRGLRHGLNEFRLREPDAVCVIGGYPIDDERIGPTPAHWKDCVGRTTTPEEDFYFFLCASLLGDPIGWATQQEGRLMHDVFPIKEHVREQLGSGSEELLTWHTEDAFHPLRTDYVGLMCLRNPDGVETTYASVDDVELPPEVAELMRREHFPIRPDLSHRPGVSGRRDADDDETRRLLERSYDWIADLEADPAPIAVLFGHPDQPYLRLDPYFMDPPGDAEEAAALEATVAAIDAAIGGYALRPGEIIFLDNYRAVHGRKPFTARFDGTDRWLRRLNISRDLRKSRGSRLSADSRVIY